MELIIFFFTLGFSSVLIKLCSNKMGWKVSWLLPIVLGFVIATISTALISIRNDQEKVETHSFVPSETTQQPATINEDTSVTPANKTSLSEDLTESEATEFAKELFKKIEEDEKFLLDAFELKEEQTLFRYVATDWHTYANKPHKFYPKAQPKFGNVYFPEGDIMKPYFVCDTAYRDLNIYASAMEHVADQDTAINRKILRQEKDDFINSKELCAKRITLKYEQALADYEKE